MFCGRAAGPSTCRSKAIRLTAHCGPRGCLPTARSSVTEPRSKHGLQTAATCLFSPTRQDGLCACPTLAAPAPLHTGQVPSIPARCPQRCPAALPSWPRPGQDARPSAGKMPPLPRGRAQLCPAVAGSLLSSRGPPSSTEAPAGQAGGWGPQDSPSEPPSSTATRRGPRKRTVNLTTDRGLRGQPCITAQSHCHCAASGPPGCRGMCPTRAALAKEADRFVPSPSGACVFGNGCAGGCGQRNPSSRRTWCGCLGRWLHAAFRVSRSASTEMPSPLQGLPDSSLLLNRKRQCH